MDVPSDLTCLEAETVRFSRRRLRPITPLELSEHLRISDRHARRVLQKLVDLQLFKVASGTKRGRSYVLKH
jgi:predicted HTH transcriptional regulator